MEEKEERTVKRGKPIVLKISPGRLAALVGSLNGRERMITPPRSLPDITPNTSAQSSGEGPKSPESSSGSGKKRTLPQSPPEAVRRSPRNHRILEANPTPLASVATREKKPHPFFLGKEARMCRIKLV